MTSNDMAGSSSAQRAALFQQHKRLAWLLGMAGLLPFIFVAIALPLAGPSNPLAGPLTDGFRTYGAVILSFLGGIRWGHAIRRGDGERDTPPDLAGLALSVAPSLAGWAALFMPDLPSLAVLLLAFCAQGAWDSFAATGGRLPAWMGPLRMTLTLVVAACHIAVLLTTL